jgi:hypothetical protein
MPDGYDRKRSRCFMNDPLATYLHDHLAGSNFAIELLKTLRDEHADGPLAQFASGLLVEIETDRGVLLGIIDRVGKTLFDVKDAAGWLAEKVSQFKLRHDHAGEPGTFEALEGLGLGIQGKHTLWQALQMVAEADARVRGADFAQLSARAQAQFAQVEARRLQVARTAFHQTVPAGSA